MPCFQYLYDWRMEHRETYLTALLFSGSLLMGSSIAYPMLSQDGSGRAQVALELFFLSAVCFNAFNILEILQYGLYTLMVCVIGMLLILLLGRDTLADYCLFIPVYTTGASFLTIAWPSLLESVGYQPGTIQDLLDPYNLPCPLVPLDSISIDTIPSNQAVSGFSSQTEWRHGPIRLTGSPTPFTQLQSVPALSERIAGEEPSGVLVSEVVPQDIRFMRPSSSASSHRADTMSSISLSSRASWPSEMSSIVLPFFSPPDPTRLPRQTSRRRDIEALGRRQSDFSLPQPLMSMPMSTAAT